VPRGGHGAGLTAARPGAGRPVVGHFEPDLAGQVGEAYLRRLGSRVLEDIRQRLLDHAVERELRARRQQERPPGHGQARRQASRADGRQQVIDVSEGRLRCVLGCVLLAHDAEQAAHLGERGPAGVRDVAHDGHRLIRILHGRIGGAVGERDHDRKIVRDDVVHLPRDPGPLGGRGELRLVVPLALQPIGAVDKRREIEPPGTNVVADEPGRRDQAGDEHPDQDSVGAAPHVLRSEQHSAGLQYRGGGQDAPGRLVGGDRVERDEQGKVVSHLLAREQLREDRHGDDSEDQEGCPAAPYQREQ
jgi:hypothetical protein